MDDGVPIHEVSMMLGVPAPTLRSWERRYGLPTTPRSAGGHRRYSQESLRQLRLMRDEVTRGRRAADAARWVRGVLQQPAAAQEHIDRLTIGSDGMRPKAIRAALDAACDDLGLSTMLDQVLLPAMRQVGAWWETGRCDVGQEHLTTEAARAWLARIMALSAVRPGRPVIFACGPEDLHTLGLEALAAVMSHRGHDCRILGARTPAASLRTAVDTTDAAAVVVVSHLSVYRRTAVDALRAVQPTGRPTFYAGNAFMFPGSRRGVPGTYLGESLTAAAEVIGRSLSTTPESSPVR